MKIGQLAQNFKRAIQVHTLTLTKARTRKKRQSARSVKSFINTLPEETRPRNVQK